MKLSSRDKILQSDWLLLRVLFKSNESIVPQAENRYPGFILQLTLKGMRRQPLRHCEVDGKDHLYKTFPDVGKGDLWLTYNCLGNVLER